MNTLDIINLSINPWSLLGISEDADDREIEQAWKNLSNANRKNDMIRQAYQLIANEEDRAKFRLLTPHMVEDPTTIIKQLPPHPKYSGPGIWYKSLTSQMKARAEEES